MKDLKVKSIKIDYEDLIVELEEDIITKIPINDIMGLLINISENNINKEGNEYDDEIEDAIYE